LAVRLLSAGTLRQCRGKKRCANGCHQLAVAYDTICHKHLCWIHLLFEHPHEVDGVDPETHETYKMYEYYGPPKDSLPP
jgi:hypothetical protein